MLVNRVRASRQAASAAASSPLWERAWPRISSACLAQPVAGRALDAGGLTGAGGGLGAVGGGETKVGEDGQRLPLQNPVAGSPRLGERLLCAGSGALELAEVAVGGGQAEQRHHLGMAKAELPRQAECVPGMTQGGARVAEAALDRGQGVAGQHLAVAVVDVAGQGQSRPGELEGLGVAAGFTVDRGKVVEVDRLAVAVPDRAVEEQGAGELVARVIQVPELTEGHAEARPRGRLVVPRANLLVRGQCRGVVVDGLQQPSQLCVDDPEIAKVDGLPSLATRLAVQCLRGDVVAGRLLELAQVGVDAAEVAEDRRLDPDPAGPAGLGKRRGVLRNRLLVPADGL
jgi:hypothetical protein